jgi:hypothetical protein
LLLLFLKRAARHRKQNERLFVIQK